MADVLEKGIDLKQAFKNTLEADVKQYGDYLTLGKVFEAIDEKKAAGECYLAFIENALKQEQKDVAALYGMTVDSSTLNSFSGPVEFVLGVFYLSVIHNRFVTDIAAKKILWQKNMPKRINPNPNAPAVQFLKWVKNPNGNRSLRAISAFDRCVRELAAKDGYVFVSNIEADQLFKRWRTAFTDSVPLDKRTDFIFAL